MLSFEQIKELIELVSEHHLRGVEIERSGFRFKIDGQASAEVAPTAHLAPAPVAVAPAAVPPAMVAAAPVAGGAVPAAEPDAEVVDESLHELTSPIVGTFYTAPNPDSDPFVSVGTKVRVGQVLCIVEAMKLMNEIESDVDGEIVEVLPKNGQPVEFGEPLFRIRVS